MIRTGGKPIHAVRADYMDSNLDDKQPHWQVFVAANLMAPKLHWHFVPSAPAAKVTRAQCRWPTSSTKPKFACPRRYLRYVGTPGQQESNSGHTLRPRQEITGRGAALPRPASGQWLRAARWTGRQCCAHSSRAGRLQCRQTLSSRPSGLAFRAHRRTRTLAR